LGDALKGTAAVLLAGVLFGGTTPLLAGFAACVGHIFPVWLGFRGGKGVATYLGVLAALYWPAGIVFAVVWGIAAGLTRTSSLGALSASLATPVALFLFGAWPVGWLFVFLTVILWLRHAENIRRLLAGREGRIGGAR
jgi:glycerol-3-phosphate acyltransferase PlsY